MIPGDATELTCKMNIAPDKLYWRFYPSEGDRAYDPDYDLVLSRARYRDLPHHMFSGDNSSTKLTINVRTRKI